MADANQKAGAANLREMALKLQAQAELLDPTDSRTPGFNPEVEASQAAAAPPTVVNVGVGAVPAPTATAPAAAAAPRGVAAVVADAVEVINGLLGNVSPLAKLIDELRSL